MDRPTIAIYEREGASYGVRRGVGNPEPIEAFGASVPAGARRLDLGCGPGHHLPLLGSPAVAVDGARAMVAAARDLAPDTPGAVADLTDLPFGPATFAGVWASKTHQHLPAADLPAALAEVSRVLEVGGRAEFTMFPGPIDDPVPADGPGWRTEVSGDDDDLAGRLFTWWHPDRLAEVVDAAALTVTRCDVDSGPNPYPQIRLAAQRRRGLPDHVGPNMKLLFCGLNPSLHAADAGVGYVTGSNRFWPALSASGLSDVDRDPRRLRRVDGFGMTDLVKRPTARADEVTAAEFRAGVERLRRLCAWLRPGAVVVVGLAGWRAGHDRHAAVGWQPEPLGESPVYLMPSTSGLNARTSLDDLVDHLRTAADGPRGPSRNGPVVADR